MLSTFYDTPKEKKLKEHVEILISDVYILNKRIDGLEEILSEVEIMDSIVYRSIFETDSYFKKQSKNYNDLEKYKSWWLVFDGEEVDLCTEDMGKDVDLYVSSSLRTMVEIWEGDRKLKAAMKDDLLNAIGARALIKNIDDWLGSCPYANIRPAQVG